MSAPRATQDCGDGGAGSSRRSVSAALERFGGIVLGPRRAVAELGDDEGHRDGLWLGSLYVLGTGTYQLAEGVATLYAVRNLGGVIAVASVVGRAILAVVLTLVVAETVLGRGRGHRRGLALVPLVLVGSVAHMARQLGYDLGVSGAEAAVVGGIVGVGLAWWIRPVVDPLASSSYAKEER